MAAVPTIVASNFTNFIHCLRWKKFFRDLRQKIVNNKTLSNKTYTNSVTKTKSIRVSLLIVHGVFPGQIGIRDANGFCHCSKIAIFIVEGKVLMSPTAYCLVNILVEMGITRPWESYPLFSRFIRRTFSSKLFLGKLFFSFLFPGSRHYAVLFNPTNS